METPKLKTVTIHFRKEEESLYVSRMLFNDTEITEVARDIRLAIKTAEEKWLIPEFGCLVTLFLAQNFSPHDPTPKYRIIPALTSTETFLFQVTTTKENEWSVARIK
jgi:hypothetical protein